MTKINPMMVPFRITRITEDLALYLIQNSLTGKLSTPLDDRLVLSDFLCKNGHVYKGVTLRFKPTNTNVKNGRCAVCSSLAQQKELKKSHYVHVNEKDQQTHRKALDKAEALQEARRMKEDGLL